MPDKLRDLRIRRQLPAKEMVSVVRAIYPKYDKTMQSTCERGSEYGVEIRPDAMAALYQKFAPELLAAPAKKHSGGHRLTCRISCRLPDDWYELLQQYAKDDGYETMQDWIAAQVEAYIADKQASNP